MAVNEDDISAALHDRQHLAERLHSACYIIADAFGYFVGEDLTEKALERIPGIAFSLAVELGMWERQKPSEHEATVFLGYYDVPASERDQFMTLIGEPMSYLRKDLAEQQTPLTIVKTYMREHGMTWAGLAEFVGISESHLRQRICNPEYTRSKRTTLEPIAKKLGCEWRQLRWRTATVPNENK